jgi:hypothetical protein
MHQYKLRNVVPVLEGEVSTHWKQRAAINELIAAFAWRGVKWCEPGQIVLDLRLVDDVRILVTSPYFEHNHPVTDAGMIALTNAVAAAATVSESTGDIGQDDQWGVFTAAVLMNTTTR